MYGKHELKIALVEVPYMSSPDPVQVTKVVAPNGGTLPISLKHRQTLKDIANECVKMLDGFKERGADVDTELTKEL